MPRQAETYVSMVILKLIKLKISNDKHNNHSEEKHIHFERKIIYNKYAVGHMKSMFIF